MVAIKHWIYTPGGTTHYNYTHGLDDVGELQQKGISLSDVCQGMSKKDNQISILNI